MQDGGVKTFKGRSYSEALRAVKESLGADAVILTNRLVDPDPGDDDRRQLVELSAATGDAAAMLMSQSAKASRARPPQHFARQPLPEADLLRAHRRRLLEEEVRESIVRDLLEAVTRRVVALGPRGAPRALDFLIMELMERIPVLPVERGKGYARTSCFLGVAGTGKTTLLAKLGVTAALRERQRVAFVGLGRRGSSREVLRMASGVIECPLKEVETPAALSQLLTELVGYDQILLDSPGVSPFDERGLESLKGFLAVAPGVECHLVVNASQRDVDVQKAVETFGRFGLKSLAFARLDEACSYGAMLNAVDSSRLPLSYFSFGKEIPGDLEIATRERVLDLLLDLSAGEDIMAAE